MTQQEEGEDLTLQRSQSYASTAPNTADTAMRMNRRLGADYREKVRGICVTSPFTTQWEYQVDAMQYMASVALMEERDYKAKRAAAVAAGGEALATFLKKESATLWEREEFAARYIVEEGKFNLIMRLCAEYKEQMIGGAKTGGLSHLQPQDLAMGRSYETSLGVLLRVSMQAVEAVQTLDLRNIIDHISSCWDHALADTYNPPFTTANARPNKNGGGGDASSASGAAPSSPTKVISTVDFLVLQEGASVAYVMWLMVHAEKLQEELIMEKMQENNMWAKLLRLVEKFTGLANGLPAQAGVPLSSTAGNQIQDFLSSVVGCYNALFQTDTYKARMNDFWPGGKADKQKWCSLVNPMVKGIIGTDAEKKKEFRPVTDALLRFS